MKINRIYALVLRFFYLFKHSYDRVSDAFYWPLIDILIWGLTTTYFTKISPGASKIILVILSGFIFWLIAWRAQYEISVNLLEELWNKNMVNIFVSPIRFTEWITAFIVVGFIKAAMSLPFAMLIIYIIYGIKLTFFSWYFVPLILLMFMSGWWMGFLICSLILRFGTKVQTFAWTLPWVFGPFSAIYYPISILPNWAQKISKLIPASYIFEAVREIINKGTADPSKFYISFAINVVYLILSILLLYSSFKKVLQKGLVKVY